MQYDDSVLRSDDGVKRSGSRGTCQCVQEVNERSVHLTLDDALDVDPVASISLTTSSSVARTKRL